MPKNTTGDGNRSGIPEPREVPSRDSAEWSEDDQRSAKGLACQHDGLLQHGPYQQ